MPVDPHIQSLLERFAASGAPPMDQGTPEAARASFLAMTVGLRRPEHVVPVASTEDVTIPGPAGGLRARVYRPEGEGPFPTVLFLHGGGWVIGDLETHDNQSRSVCRHSRVVVVSAEYRLAPEAPWPAAVEDAEAALTWVAGRLDTLGGDDRLGLAGDSAGGNLAAVLAAHARDAGGPPVAGQLLVYPSVDFVGDHPSRVENARGYLLEQPTIAWFAGHYAPDPASHRDPRVSPLYGDLAGLPPTVVVTAEFDPLRDEGEAYAAALRAAGVTVHVRRFDGLVHGFFDLGAVSPGAQAAIEESCRLFAEVLGS